jgi:hypothetical protein
MFKDTWGGFTAEAFRHVLPGMKLAIPSAVMVCFEHWSFEILVLLAGLLPQSQLSTSIIAMWYVFHVRVCMISNQILHVFFINNSILTSSVAYGIDFHLFTARTLKPYHT